MEEMYGGYVWSICMEHMYSMEGSICMGGCEEHLQEEEAAGCCTTITPYSHLLLSLLLHGMRSGHLPQSSQPDTSLPHRSSP
jgi:hypothetical protein